MKIEKDMNSGRVCLTQKGYLQKVLQKFNINGDKKSVSTPLAPDSSPTIVEERDYMCHVPYISAVSSLMYAMVCTRHDLSKPSAWLVGIYTIPVGVIGRL